MLKTVRRVLEGRIYPLPPLGVRCNKKIGQGGIPAANLVSGGNLGVPMDPTKELQKKIELEVTALRVIQKGQVA